MGDGGQQAGAFTQRLAEQVHRPVLRDDPVDDRARGDHTGTFGERRHNLADPFGCCGGHRHDGDAAFARPRAQHEVELPARPAEHLRADGVGAHLPREVDLDGGVERHHLRVRRNHGGIVGVGHVVDQNVLVFMDIVVQFLCPFEEGGDVFAHVHPLLAAVDHAAFNQGQHAVGEHLGVDAKMLVVTQLRQDGVGDVADTDLERGTVGDEGGGVASDGDVLVRKGGEFRFDQRHIVANERRDFR